MPRLEQRATRPTSCPVRRYFALITSISMRCRCQTRVCVRPWRCRSFSCAFSVGKRSGQLDGSSTICAKITARAATSGRRAHLRCIVEGCRCLMDFSPAEALLIASSVNATSCRVVTRVEQSCLRPYRGGRSTARG